jgi:hypothetical protein
VAKELPFFKFEPSQWENGTIQMCSFEAQGVFISVCSMYWQRLGDLPYKLAVGKICKGNATALDSLIEDGIIKVIEGHICIDFLNEQLSGFASISEINSKNAREGWEKRRKDATPLPTHSEPNAIREDKKKEEEKKKDKIKEDHFVEVLVWPSFEDFWDKYDKKKGRPKSESLWQKISQGGREKIMAHLDEYTKVEKQYRKDPERYLKNQGWEDEVILKLSTNGTGGFKDKREQQSIDRKSAFANRVNARSTGEQL